FLGENDTARSAVDVDSSHDWPTFLGSLKNRGHRIGECLRWGPRRGVARPSLSEVGLRGVGVRRPAFRESLRLLRQRLLVGAGQEQLGIFLGDVVLDSNRSEEHTSELQSRENLV